MTLKPRFLVSCVGLLALLVGCDHKSPSAAPEKTEPAHVAHHVDENELNTITLTPQAASRLGIKLAEVARTKMRPNRVVGGEVVLPPGQTIIVTAPIAGTLQPPLDGQSIAPGKRMQQGQVVFRFKPLLSAERDVLTPSERVSMAQTKADVATAQLEARRRVESAKVELDAAELAYERASQLFNSKAGSKRALDEAETQRQLAEEAKQTAEARLEFLSSINLDEAAGELESRDITAPVGGLLIGLDAAAGETVAAGQTLFSVMKTDKVWIRVPVYVGHRHKIDTSAAAAIREVGGRTDQQFESATFVEAPPAADPIANTVDLHYELDNSDGKLYPGQKLVVTLPLIGKTDCITIPFDAVLYDVNGGAWVYQLQDEHVYARQRVLIEYVDDGTAVLAEGLEPGAQVVTEGVAELFGTEFGVGH
tara:strand:- start:25482 stop:26747 length:1266 start_codon:yes stop_codon:yes gene_type:complete